MQGVLRGRRRHRLVGGRRHAPRRAAERRPPQRAPRARRRPGLGRQPGRRLQRLHGAQRPVPAAGDPPGPGERGPVGRGRGRGRGPRHGHPARRPDRGTGAAGHLRPGPRPRAPVAARLGEVQPRPHPGRGRSRRDHQDGPGDAARRTAADLARGYAVVARGLGVRRGGTPGHRAAGVAGGRPAVAGGRLVVRHQRHQRPCDRGTGGTGRRTGTRIRGGARRGALAGVGQVRGGPGGADRADLVAAGRVVPGGRRFLARQRPFGLRAPRGAAGAVPRRRTVRGGPGPRGDGPLARGAVLRPGRAARRDGPGTVRPVRRVRRGAGRRAEALRRRAAGRDLR